MNKLDSLDKKILDILQIDATTSKVEIARQVKLTPSAVAERIRRLEANNIILGYHARLNAKNLNFSTLAFVSIKEHKPTGDIKTGEILSNVTGVEEVHKIAGTDCFLVKIRARNIDELNMILENEINPIPSISGTSTTIVLKTFYEQEPQLNLS